MVSFLPCTNLPHFQFSLILPLLIFSITIHATTFEDFIKTSCGMTRYPELCYQSLSSYANIIQANPTQLANVALNVTLESAQNTSNVVLKMMKAHNLKSKEVSAMKDCVETMKDSVEELRESLVVMRDLEGPDFALKVSNVQTWVSAALTDEDTCLNGFEGKPMNGNVKETIRRCLERDFELTSNALALINLLV
ncbi:Plant invertase/pectin methylesterase inhibitor superfamily protein [Euphorbia peplus]|nr:Plant invertase/pectin methylesterase inhibitor superfamily protein [Euphorbia peplus]